MDLLGTDQLRLMLDLRPASDRPLHLLRQTLALLHQLLHIVPRQNHLLCGIQQVHAQIFVRLQLVHLKPNALQKEAKRPGEGRGLTRSIQLLYGLLSMITSAFFFEHVAICCSSLKGAAWKNSNTRLRAGVMTLLTSESESSSLQKEQIHIFLGRYVFIVKQRTCCIPACPGRRGCQNCRPRFRYHRCCV